MRCLLLILLALTAPARHAFAQEDVLLLEERAWKGTIEVTAVSRAPERVKGEERQTERIEFVLVTKPPRRTLARARLPFELQGAKGEWRLAVDTCDGEGEAALKTSGRGAGRDRVANDEPDRRPGERGATRAGGGGAAHGKRPGQRHRAIGGICTDAVGWAARSLLAVRSVICRRADPDRMDDT